MRSNTIRARLAFSFKGETCELDLALQASGWMGRRPAGRAGKGSRLEKLPALVCAGIAGKN